MTLNPLTISLMTFFGICFYILAGWGTHWFLWNVRKWHNAYEDERLFCCGIWPFTMTIWLAIYGGVFFWAFVTYPFRKIEKNCKIKAARVRRSGKEPRIVK
jgi:hypothetical protein